MKSNLQEYWDDLEIIFIDDGSKDNTFEQIKTLSADDDRVRGVRFSRNFGVQSALLAGYKESKGELVVTMDSDGQHPPEIIHDMIKEQEKGYDIVNTIRESTADASWFKRKSSKWFNKVINRLSDVDIRFEYSDFRMLNRMAVDSFLAIDEQNRFARGLVSWMGFRQTAVRYTAAERHKGETKWTLTGLIRLGMDGITSFSSKPLRISFIIGVIAIIFGLIYSIYAVIVFITDNTIPGWPSMMITILFLGGFQLLTLGIIGEYIARIFNESKKRPHYFIQERCGE
jgi:dolichol-phosphate mannosyltransferase